MRTKLLALAAVGLLATAAMTACDGSGDTDDAGDGGTGTGGSGKAKVGVIMPDTKSSTRWSTDDPKYLKQTFDKNGVPVEIQNAQGDKENFKRIAKDMIAGGAKVLIMANLDSISGKAVIDDAHAKNVKVIDYDRLTLNGNADYYVSFDGGKVGEQQAYGLRNCLSAKKVTDPVIAELNGSPTDNNATLFKEGYDGVLQPFFDDSTYTKGPDQWVPDWDNDEGAKIFSQMLSQQPKISGVLAANDGLGNAVIEVLRKKGLNGKVPVTGQDATVQGLQNILAGDQCMTVYKPFQPLAETAANLATELFQGKKVTANTQPLKDPESGGYVPFVSLPPSSIDITKVKSLVDDGYVTKKQLCTGKFAALCKQHGIK
nr:substrate-binding domain-containing protein [uncultured Actinoplanes sp.]